MSFEIDRGDESTAPEKAAQSPAATPNYAGDRAPLEVPSPPELRPASRFRWVWRAGLATVAAATLSQCYLAVGHRPKFLPLSFEVDGVATRRAGSLLVLLHGYGGSPDDMAWVVRDLRKRGLPASTSVVTVAGPFATGFGRTWGDSAGEIDESESRLVELLAKRAGSLPPEKVFLAGFSQGAQLAMRVSARSTRVGTTILLSGCNYLWPAPEGAAHPGKLIFVHGSSDRICNFGQAEAAAKALEKRGLSVEFIPFEGDHVIDNTSLLELSRALAE